MPVTINYYTAWNIIQKDGWEIFRCYYLDRHEPVCNYRQAMSYFNLQPNDWYNPSQVRFNYQCKGFPGLWGTVNWYSTPQQDYGQGNTRYLGRHNVECPWGQVMRSFKLVSPGGVFWFSYSCMPASIGWYQDLETPYQTSGGGSVQYFGYHYIQCPGNSVLHRWRLFTYSDGTWMDSHSYKILYRCAHPA